MEDIKLVNTYYNLCTGIEPNKEDIDRTMATVKHLKDNGYGKQEIFKILKEIGKTKIEGQDLPDRLWEDSLTDKGVFYYSSLLHIKSKAPTWDPKTFQVVSEPFFMEMKIRYTMDDLLDHYYSECRVPIGLRDRKKDAGAFNHLLNKYNSLKAPALDYILMLITLMSEDIEVEFCAEVFELNAYAKDAFVRIESIAEEAILNKCNTITWRK